MSEPVRNEKGHYLPGQSGNAGGRPRGVQWFRKACRKRTLKALKALETALDREEHAVAAAKVLLEFAWGKASSVAAADEDVRPASAEVREDMLEALGDELASAEDSQPH